MKKIVELKKLLEVCAEGSSRKEWVRSRRIHEYRKFSEGKSNWEKVTNDDIKDGTFVVPEGVTEIRDFAFDGCTSMKSIIIPAGVTKIGNWVFCRCTSLSSIIIPEGVTKIGKWAFVYCTSMKSIIIPESVTEIRAGAFDGCKSLKKIIIPEGVTEIGKFAFYGCTSLSSIIIPEWVTKIGKWAFENCTSLSSIIIPDGVTEIGYKTFYGCKNLKKVYLPKKVKLGIEVFHGCHPDLKIVYRVSKGRRSLREAIGDIPDYILDELAGGRSWWEIVDYDSDHCIFLVDLDIEAPVNPDDPETPVNPDARLDTYVVVDFDKRGKVTDIVTEIYVDDDYIYGEAYLQTRNKELLQRAQSEIDKMLREKEEYKRRRRPANLDRAP